MRVFTVSQINRYIKSLLEDDVFLSEICMEGEISNFKSHFSGHMYFSLKDRDASINCVMFRSNAELVRFVPENGMKVTVSGYVSLYEKTGQYQFYAVAMEKAGRGALYAEFERLKERLLAEGLFDPSRKKEIPKYPSCVCVLTSTDGAVLHDIINVMRRRNGSVELVAVNVSVQGRNAAPEITEALKLVNDWGKPDVLILARGGGSIEDLWAFNEESVARAISKSKIPVVSAVGHETDYTIADFAADLRAPTPSAAAELAVPDLRSTAEHVNGLKIRLDSACRYKLTANRQRLNQLTNRRIFLRPADAVAQRMIYIENLTDRLEREMSRKIHAGRFGLLEKTGRLKNLSPLNSLARGYAIAKHADGSYIKSIEQVCQEQEIQIVLSDGTLIADVKSVTLG